VLLVKVNSAKPPQLAGVVVTLARLRYRPHRWTRSAAPVPAFLRLPSCPSARRADLELALMLSLPPWPCRRCRYALDDLAQWTQNKLQNFSPGELAASAYAFASLGYSHSRLWARFEHHALVGGPAKGRLARMEVQQQLQLLAAFAAVGERRLRLLDAVHRHLLRRWGACSGGLPHSAPAGPSSERCSSGIGSSGGGGASGDGSGTGSTSESAGAGSSIRRSSRAAELASALRCLGHLGCCQEQLLGLAAEVLQQQAGVLRQQEEPEGHQRGQQAGCSPAAAADLLWSLAAFGAPAAAGVAPAAASWLLALEQQQGQQGHVALEALCRAAWAMLVLQARSQLRLQLPGSTHALAEAPAAAQGQALAELAQRLLLHCLQRVSLQMASPPASLELLQLLQHGYLLHRTGSGTTAVAQQAQQQWQQQWQQQQQQQQLAAWFAEGFPGDLLPLDAYDQMCSRGWAQRAQQTAGQLQRCAAALQAAGLPARQEQRVGAGPLRLDLALLPGDLLLGGGEGGTNRGGRSRGGAPPGWAAGAVSADQLPQHLLQLQLPAGCAGVAVELLAAEHLVEVAAQGAPGEVRVRREAHGAAALRMWQLQRLGWMVVAVLPDNPKAS
jgi:hypothetical protein